MKKDIPNKYLEANKKRSQHVEQILKSKSKKKIVVAGPGTGKTYLFKEILKASKRSLTLTFVNSLVEDLSLELKGLSEVRTLHSFARSALSTVVKKQVRIFPKLSDVIRQDARILLGEDIDFDKIFHDRDDANKNIDFYKTRKNYYDNHYGYSDIVFAAVKYLEQHRDKVPTYEQIVVDEFQDFNRLEVSLIDLLSEKSPIVIAGDDDQALYPFKNASPDYIRHRHNIGEGYEPFTLPFCSRCTRVVVDAANDFVKSAIENKFLDGRINKPYDYFDDERKDEESHNNQNIIYTQQFSSRIPWFIGKEINKIAQEVKGKFSVLIISPIRSQAGKIAKALKEKGFTNLDYVDKRLEKGPTLLDGLKILLEDEKSNLGWRIVAEFILEPEDFQNLLKKSNETNETKISDLVDTEQRKRAKKMLQVLRKVKNDKAIDNESFQLLNEIGFDTVNIVREIVKDEIVSDRADISSVGLKKIPIKITTIQSSKGLDGDYVFITHFDDLFFIKDKDNTISDQDICNFLVALTRTRKRVYLITSQGKDPVFLKWINPERIERV